MAKTMTKTQSNTTAFALQFLGGLVFLAVAWQLWGVAYAPSNWGSALTSGAFFATIFYAVAVLSAVSLLFVSCSQFGGMGRMGAWRAMKTTSMAAFALVILTASNKELLVITLLGFLISSAGTASAMGSCNCESK